MQHGLVLQRTLKIHPKLLNMAPAGMPWRSLSGAPSVLLEWLAPWRCQELGRGWVGILSGYNQ